MNPIEIIKKFYNVDSNSYKILVTHSEAVTKKSLEVAARVPQLNPDLKFIAEAAMLHDVGIFLTDASDLGCFGDKPYICHGYLGAEILRQVGFPRHALVCERHTGLGLSLQDILSGNLPLPKRDMRPVSVEEKIICWADKFFSKNPESLLMEKSVEDIKAEQLKFGTEKIAIFDEYLKMFGN